jgi:hypothetical protein
MGVIRLMSYAGTTSTGAGGSGAEVGAAFGTGATAEPALLGAAGTAALVTGAW